MTIKYAFAALAALALTACEPAPTTTAAAQSATPVSSGCSSPIACEIASGVAADMRADRGEDFGGGVVLRDARADDETIVMQLNLPVAGSTLDSATRTQLGSVLAQTMVAELCSDRDVRTFFDLGGNMRLQTFGTDGAVLTDSTLRSC